jgi:WD40 repeat protein/predicted Ser/Thr protein kinase
MADHVAERVRTLFAEAVTLPPERRSAYLDAACRGDADLRRQLEGLLQSVETPKIDDDPTLVPTPGVQAVPSPRPRYIGQYRIVRSLASGGMGTVYEAEQDNPRRTVALKVLRHGLAVPDLMKRFAGEAQILALLHHPGIAQVYDAGLAADGQPYFAMEFIRGLPLDEYARLHSLTVAARLALLARVCDAVQHAHDKGVIHRDLKPANLLVDETGQPKVLDFGIARVTDADLATDVGLTQAGELLGTPDYMSPEQLSADPAAIDHRADVYALGVVLFELLAHRLPYHVRNRPLAGAARAVVEQEPAPLGSIDPSLRGDVETIVAKALEKEPARRYQSAAELAADLRRALNHEPILARPPTALYQLRKFARRNKGLVAGVAGAFVALLAGTVVSLVFAVRAEHNAAVAGEKERLATWQTYRARIAAAVAALSAHDVADARRHLDEAPEDSRDWEWHHLRSRLDDSSAVLAARPGEALFLLPDPDGLRVGVLGPTSLRLSDPDGGRPTELPLAAAERWAVVGPRGEVRISEPDGDDTLRLLDETGRVQGTVSAAKQAKPAALSPDGSRLAVARELKEGSFIDLYETVSGRRTGTCVGHTSYIWCVRFSPDGTRVASAGEEGHAFVWDAVTGVRLADCRGHRTKVLCVAFRPDGKQLVTASSDGTVRQWSAESGLPVGSPYARHTGETVAAAYSPDGKWIASGGTDRTIRVWKAEDHEDVAALHGHTGTVSGIAFAPDGLRMASVSQAQGFGLGGDDTVRLWEADPAGASLPVLRGHKRYVYPVAYSPDGRTLASGSWDGTVRLWDARTGEPGAVLRHPDTVLAMAFGPDGSWLVTGGHPGNGVRVWDVAAARVRKEIAPPDGWVRFLAVSPDGAQVAVSRDGALVSVLNAVTGEEIWSGEGAALAYSPDGRWLAWRDKDGKTLLLRDARTHKVIRTFSGHEGEITSAAFSPVSPLLASCSRDRTVRLWPIDGGPGRVLSGHTDEVFAAAFHPRGTRLATAGRDRAVWLWDLGRDEEVARLPGHTSYVWSLAFSPDGKTLASGSGDGTVRLWDTEPLKVRYQARNHQH